MKQATIHINKSIEEVKTAFPSIFSKDDVIRLLKQLSENIENDDDIVNGTFDKDALFDKIRDAVKDRIDGMDSDDIVDKSSCEFSIRHSNEVELEECGIDTSNIIDEVMRAVDEVFDEIKSEVED